ncbi:MAG: endonuclease [Marinilabiliales bacterium]|nr:MAG: endonuclease [Marinilabiliales bacterium]
MAEHNELGIRGEDIAASHLAAGSYSILEKNWRSGHLEVDIIARKGNQLIIAEVKTRTRGFLETLTGTVNKRKQKLLIRAANSYILKNDLDVDVRFDIITVIFEGDQYRIEHMENAFSAVG